jgi:chemotaxis protein methyltransferase CheR
MTGTTYEPDRVERFRAVVARRLGLHFDDTRLGGLAEAFERCVGASGIEAESYLGRLERASAPPTDMRELVDALTVGETYFFRNIQQFRAFAEVVLPERLSARSADRTLRILSAGCASGEEAYSLAIVLRERLAASEASASITGVDINAAALERASRGIYSKWSLRETPPSVSQRWFQPVGREHALDSSIRAAVHFEERNLADEASGVWPSEMYDAIFCRNVLMYFTPDAAHAVVARLSRALVPGGYLFLGHAETLRGLSHDFHLCHTHDTFYYQRKEGPLQTAKEARLGAGASWPAADVSLAQPDWASTWIETVQRSAKRIQELSEHHDGSTVGGAPSSGALGPTLEVRRAMDLLERERFAEALALLGDLPCEAARDPDVLLLRAVLLTHSGELEAAEKVCSELRGLDEMSAGAHYLLALCREGAGDRKGAEEHDLVAAYLDPGFAMPHLHLGLLARRAGDVRGARRQLREALSLLDREEPSRILFFGGGFTREALMRLCRAELHAAGGDE